MAHDGELTRKDAAQIALVKVRLKTWLPSDPEALDRDPNEALKLPGPASYTYQTNFGFFYRTIVRNEMRNQWRQQDADRRPPKMSREQVLQQLIMAELELEEDGADEAAAARALEIELRDFVVDSGAISQTQAARAARQLRLERDPDRLFAIKTLAEAISERPTEWWLGFFRSLVDGLAAQPAQRWVMVKRLQAHPAIRLLFEIRGDDGLRGALADAAWEARPPKPGAENQNFDYAKTNLITGGRLASAYLPLLAALYHENDDARSNWTRLFRAAAEILDDYPEEGATLRELLRRRPAVQRVLERYGDEVFRTFEAIGCGGKPAGEPRQALKQALNRLQGALASDAWSRLRILLLGPAA